MKREGCFWKGNNMKIIIIQGMTCLGKNTLCKQLEKDLPNSKHFSLDEYKENMWGQIRV
jgi:uridine kinase